MANACSNGHSIGAAALRAYVATRDANDDLTRDVLIFCKEHGKDFLGRVSSVCEFNGTSARGPFHDNTQCHWGQHDLDDYSEGAMFVTVYARGTERMCYRSLLCATHLDEVRSALNLSTLAAR